ncbi:MAG: hypothetical protein IKF51_02775 [Solobacterium sp.]|nr:hypothetical protein [Solobacterium sp.]
MMKKMIACLLALSLIGCASKDPKKILTQAYTKDAGTTSMTIDGEMQMEMNVGGMAIAVPIDTDVMYDLGNKDDKTDDRYYISVSLSVLGQNVDLGLWVDAGNLYMDVMGDKVRTSFESPEVTDADRNALMGGFLDTLENLKLTQDGDNRIITGTINKQKMAELYKKIMEQSGTDENIEEALDALDDALESMEFGEVRITVGKDGYISLVELDGSINIEDTAGTITSVFELKDRNATVLPSFDPEDFKESSGELPEIDDVIETEEPEDGDEFQFDDYTTQIWFDDGAEYWIRSPKEKSVSLYYDDEDGTLYFFDDVNQSVLADGIFMETGTITALESQISADTDNYRQIRSGNDRGMLISEYDVLKETDYFYADTRATFIIYPDRTYSLVMFDETGDHEKYTDVMSAVDFDLAH